MFSFFKKNILQKTKSSKVVTYSVLEGSKNRSLEEIDTSYWKTEDKAWVADRRERWPKIERVLEHLGKSKKGLTIIKAYFLRGQMPNWQALASWRDYGGHVDLFTFLGLHPSWDEDLLKELRDLYILSEVIVKRDLDNGFGLFMSSQISGGIRHLGAKDFPYLEGRGELMFRVMFGNPAQAVYPIANPDFARRYGRVCKVTANDLGEISLMGKWLCMDMKYPLHQDFLYQYDEPLEWWYRSNIQHDHYFTDLNGRDSLPSFERALCQIHSFDTEKEGDTNRTRFAHKIRKILDEREFYPDFKQMWLDVKSGKIAIENPCEDLEPDWDDEED